MAETQVLIVGAGPTGLVLALWLTRLGVQLRIVDRAAAAGTTSRALAVQARTLELYRQLDLAEAVIAGGRTAQAANLWVRGRKAAHVPLGAIGRDISPYAYLLMYAQDEHEKLLIERLRQAGVEVERRVELLGFEEAAAGVRAALRGPDGQEEVCDAAYLAGCDGGRSAVRRQLEADFPGGTYEHLFYVADVAAAGPAMDGDLHVALDTADFLAVFPLNGEGRARLIGTVRDARAQHPESLGFDDVSRSAIEHLKIAVERVNWFSTYHVHHRVAGRFRSGRAFLLGDAAHLHSPVGGQGMNTGIGDAINLAWKLAAVVGGRAPDSLLDSYEAERPAFAHRLVATTDRVFTVVTATGGFAKFVRTQIAPRLIPLAFSIKAVRRFLFRTVSQAGVAYRTSPLSAGAAGKVRGGERMPWVRFDQGDNFDGLDPACWHVQVYGPARPELAAWCERNGVRLHLFPWEDRFGRAGLARGAAYLLRPDTYVALAQPDGRPEPLARYFTERGLRPA